MKPLPLICRWVLIWCLLGAVVAADEPAAQPIAQPVGNRELLPRHAERMAIRTTIEHYLAIAQELASSKRTHDVDGQMAKCAAFLATEADPYLVLAEARACTRGAGFLDFGWRSEDVRVRQAVVRSYLAKVVGTGLPPYMEWATPRDFDLLARQYLLQILAETGSSATTYIIPLCGRAELQEAIPYLKSLLPADYDPAAKPEYAHPRSAATSASLALARMGDERHIALWLAFTDGLEFNLDAVLYVRYLLYIRSPKVVPVLVKWVRSDVWIADSHFPDQKVGRFLWPDAMQGLVALLEGCPKSFRFSSTNDARKEFLQWIERQDELKLRANPLPYW